jgi:phage terminase small subunit
MSKRILNKTQKKFCREYLKDFNATQAAIRAGYSKKTAYSQGGRLLKHVEVKEHLDQLIDEAIGTQREQIKYRVLEELQSIAFVDITKDVNIVKKVATDKETGEEIEYTTVEIKGTENSENKRAIASIEKDSKGAIKLKYHDKVKALELLGRYGAMFTDKVETKVTELEIGKPPEQFPDES